MKNKIAEFFMSYLFIMWNLIELLLAPLIFTTVGMIYQVTWPYYLVSIGGYYAVMAVWEIVARYLSKNSDKEYHCPLVRSWQRVKARLNATSDENAE